MIEITYEKLRDPFFYRAMVKLANSDAIRKPKALLGVAKIFSAVQKEWKLGDEIHTKLLDRFSEKDEGGENKRVPGETDRIVLKTDSKDEYLAADKEFKAMTCQIESHKISFDDLSEVGLTPCDVAALEPFLDVSSAEGLSLA